MCTATRIRTLKAECMGKLLGCDSFDYGECRRDFVNVELIISESQKLISIFLKIYEAAL